MAKKKSSTAAPLTAISPVEFVSRFKSSVTEQEQRFTWFVGAGCSISSGIKAASGLVQQWLSELWDMQKLPQNRYREWLAKTFPDYDAGNPATHYAQVFARRHPAPADRQREIERICDGGEPSYGYATFAQLLSDPEVGKRCNTILTTNFDDLVADALYVYGDRRSRPQVITHEALARYVRIASPRPTIVKLHGDAHLDPKNLSPETKRIQADVARQLHPLLLNSAIVFVGYGGNDESIAHFFDECPSASLAPQIYWVGKHDPASSMLKWLGERGALRVDHTDFDQLMHLIRGKLDIPHPQKERWDRAFKEYFDHYERFEKELNSAPESQEKDALRQASQEVRKTLPSEWDYYAKTLGETSADEKYKIFLEGLEALPESALLNRAYALFLWRERENISGAEIYYKRAIELDPNHPNSLGNYAVFLQKVGEDADVAEAYYKRAIDADPAKGTNLVNYAQLLFSQSRKSEGLDLLHKAIAADLRPGDRCEAEFYRFAHDEARRDSSLSGLKKTVLSGARSRGWDFSTNIEQAAKDGFQDIALLKDLAKVISEDAPVSILDKYEEWRNA